MPKTFGCFLALAGPIAAQILTILFVFEQRDALTARCQHQVDGEANDLAGAGDFLEECRGMAPYSGVPRISEWPCP